MDDDAHITNLLHTFARWPMAFGTDELLYFATIDIDSSTLVSRLISDPRFISLNESDSHEQTYLAKATLFRFFFLLNCRLARMHVFHIRETQLLGAMSVVAGLHRRGSRVPMSALEFGNRFGLISLPLASGQYVFPIALGIRSACVTQPGTIERLVDELWSTVSEAGTALSGVRDRLLRIGFNQFDRRTARIVKAREGLVGAGKKTLEQVGKRYGVTRERIRQIEASFWNKVKRFDRSRRPFLLAFVCDLMSRSGCLIVSERRTDVMRVRFLAKCARTTYETIPFTHLMLLGGLPERFRKLDSNARAVDADEIAKELESSRDTCLTKPDAQKLAKVLARLSAKRLTLARMVYLALHRIGRPAHFSEVADEFQRMFPRRKVIVRNIHAVLCREQHGIVWIGLKGTYALREWGFGRPSKKLFDVAAQIVEDRFAQTGEPVPFSVIVAEFPKYRPMFRRSSVTMAVHLNPKLQRVSGNRFLPRTQKDEPLSIAKRTAWDKALLRLERSKGTNPLDQ